MLFIPINLDAVISTCLYSDEGGLYYNGIDGQKHYVYEFYAPKGMTVIAPGDKIEFDDYHF